MNNYGDAIIVKSPLNIHDPDITHKYETSGIRAYKAYKHRLDVLTTFIFMVTITLPLSCEHKTKPILLNHQNIIQNINN